MSFDIDNYKELIQHGEYYFPAWKHYCVKNANVVCDMCLKQYLTSCIGYKKQDLCLHCADNLAKIHVATWNKSDFKNSDTICLNIVPSDNDSNYSDDNLDDSKYF